MKIAVLFHTESGNTKRVAEMIRDGAMEVQGVEARAIDIEDADTAFLDQAGAIIFGCPTYCGSLSWQMKKFLDETGLKLAGKLGSAFATENHIGGGADFAELVIIGGLLVRGMLVYTGGASESPFTHFGAVAIKAGDEAQTKRAASFGRRVARKAVELFGA